MMKLSSGYEVTPLEGEELQRQLKEHEGYKDGLVRLSPGRWLFPSNYTRYADGLYNFKFRKSDVVIMTWPKCGTNWTQEIIWTMQNNPNLDHPNANTRLLVRSPHIDFDISLPVPNSKTTFPLPFLMEDFQEQCPGRDPPDGINLTLGEVAKDPRTLKSHMPFSMLTPSLLDTCKVVYVARNPKDVVISYHHHSKIIKLHGFVGKFEDFVQLFVDDDLVYGPYWLHLKEAWERKDHPNLHIILFEDLKKNTLEEFKKLNKFLETNLTEKQLEGIVKYTSFNTMKNRMQNKDKKKDENLESQPSKEDKKVEEKPAGGGGDDEDEGKGFFRKGIVGDWKNKLSPDLDAKMDQWIQKHLEPLGIHFKY